MSFEWTDISYDSARKLNTMQRMVSVNNSDSSKLDYRWQRVPYELTFNVGINFDCLSDKAIFLCA